MAARTRRRHAQVHRLVAAGRSLAAIAAEPGLSGNTVRRFARAADPGVLWQEIRSRGYPGGYCGVRDYPARFRGNAVIPAPAAQPPKPRGYHGS